VRQLHKLTALLMTVLLLSQAILPAAAAETPPGQVPLYLQQDYPNDRYGDGSIETNGCSVVCLAMVATYLTGHTYLPDELARYFGGRAENNIARLELASDALRLPWEKAEDCHDAFTALEEGKPVIAMMNKNSLFTDTQHFIVLTGMNEDGLILVNDPNEINHHAPKLEKAFVKGFTQGEITLGFSGAWIYDPESIPDEPFIYREGLPNKENPRYPDLELTYEEKELLAKLIWVEAQGEPFEGQQAVAEVVFNRMYSQRFGGTLEEVIYSKGQFRSVPLLEDAAPFDTQFEAIEAALYGPYVLPVNVYHFAPEAPNDNVWGQIGGHVFCYSHSNNEDPE